MNKLIFTLVLTLVTVFRVQAGYDLTVTSKGLDGQKLLFGYIYFDNHNFIVRDSVILGAVPVHLDHEKTIFGGIYELKLEGSTQSFKFRLYNNEKMNIKLSKMGDRIRCTTDDPVNNQYLSIQQLEYDIKFRQDSVAENFKGSNMEKGAAIQAINKDLKSNLSSLRKQLQLKVGKEDVLYSILECQNFLDETTPIKGNQMMQDSILKITPFNDKDFFISPMIQQMLLRYFAYSTYDAEHIIPAMDRLLEVLDCNALSYKYIFNFLIKVCKNTNIVGADDCFAYLIENYLQKSDCQFFDEATKQKYINQLSNMSHIQVADTLRELEAVGTEGQTISLIAEAKKYDYTLLLFYSPTCKHCQKEIPLIDKNLRDIESMNHIKILRYAVVNDFVTQTQIDEFIDSNHLDHHWLNLNWNASHRDNDIEYFNAYSNPTIYLIDKNGIVLGKNLSAISVKKILLSEQKSK